MEHIGRVNVFETAEDLVKEVTDVIITQLLRLEQLVHVCLH